MTGNGAAGWGFIGEISSQRLRPYTAGFGAASTCVVGVLMSTLVPYMVNANQWAWGFKTGWFYAGVGLPFTVGMWLLIPETRGYVLIFSLLGTKKVVRLLILIPVEALRSLTSSSSAGSSHGGSTRPRLLRNDWWSLSSRGKA
jgi:hypothetical protein